MMQALSALVAIGLTALIAWPALADKAKLDPAHEAAARRLIDATELAENTRDLYRQQVAQIMGQMQERNPDMPGRAFDIIEEEFDAITPTVVAEMVEIAVGMYAERFTTAEMNEISAFYASDVGQKALRELRLLAESRAIVGHEIGQRLGRVAAERAVARIRAEGIQMGRQ